MWHVPHNSPQDSAGVGAVSAIIPLLASSLLLSLCCSSPAPLPTHTPLYHTPLQVSHGSISIIKLLHTDPHLRAYLWGTETLDNEKFKVFYANRRAIVSGAQHVHVTTLSIKISGEIVDKLQLGI